MRGAKRHATGGNWRVGVYFLFSLYEHIYFTLRTLPMVFIFLIAFIIIT